MPYSEHIMNLLIFTADNSVDIGVTYMMIEHFMNEIKPDKKHPMNRILSYAPKIPQDGLFHATPVNSLDKLNDSFEQHLFKRTTVALSKK